MSGFIKAGRPGELPEAAGYLSAARYHRPDDHRGLRDQPQILLLSLSGYFHQLCTLRQGMTEHLLRRIHTGVDDL